MSTPLSSAIEANRCRSACIIWLRAFSHFLPSPGLSGAMMPTVAKAGVQLKLLK